MTRIAFLGLGAMGSRMAARLISHYDVIVYNRSPKRSEPLRALGAKVAKTPKEAAEYADVIFTILTDDNAAESVWMDPENGVLAGLKSDTIAIESSTVTPSWVKRLGEAVEHKGARFLDAPVAGSTPQAEAGMLAFMVGGDEDDFRTVLPIMSKMGGKVLYAGARGQGAVLKLAVNTLFATQVALIAELLPALAQEGMPGHTALELLGQLPVTSPATKGAATLMLKNDHVSRFPTKLIAKDLRYAAAMGNLPLTGVVKSLFEKSEKAGYGDKNLTAIHRTYCDS